MNDQQLFRYSRHILLPQLDFQGQQTLLNSKVLIIGLGGLGSPVALYLAASGVGRLVLVDDDAVELSNLQRQIVHQQASIGQSKVSSAKAALHALNDEIEVEIIAQRLQGEALLAAIAAVDVVVDCTDNFASRFAINAACYQLSKPWVSAAAIRMEAQVTVFDPRLPEMPCYRCLYDDTGQELQQSCSESGVLAPMLGIIGSIQATETLKLLAGFGETLAGKLLMLDAMTMQWRQIRLKADPVCPVCHHNGN